MKTLWDVAGELSRRLTTIFLRDEKGHRPVFGNLEKFQKDPHWRDLVLFHEYFHGDSGSGVGASHQTGWTGMITKLMQQSGEFREGKNTESAVATVPTSAGGLRGALPDLHRFAHAKHASHLPCGEGKEQL
jgi:hypothetical protein